MSQESVSCPSCQSLFVVPPRARQVGLALCPHCQAVIAASQHGAVVATEESRVSRPYSAADRYRARQKLRQPKNRRGMWIVGAASLLMFALLSWYAWWRPSGTGDGEDSAGEGQERPSIDVGNRERTSNAVASAGRPVDTEQDLEMNRLLDGLASRNPQTTQQAVIDLLKIPVQDSRRSEVTGLLEKLLESADLAGRQKVLQALARWSDERTVKVIVYAIESSHHRELRQTGIRALGGIGSKESCAALAALMDNAPTQELAVLGQALRVAGPVAEDAEELLPEGEEWAENY